MTVEISADHALTDVEAHAVAAAHINEVTGYGAAAGCWKAVGDVLVTLKERTWTHAVYCRRELTHEQFLSGGGVEGPELDDEGAS